LNAPATGPARSGSFLDTITAGSVLSPSCGPEQALMDTMTDVDVQRIVAQIREKLRRGLSEDGGPAPPPVEVDPQLVSDLSALFTVSDPAQAHFASHRKILGSLVVGLKRTLRKLLTPILTRQASYNATNARVVNRLHEHLVALGGRHARRRDELLAVQQHAVKDLRQQIASIQGIDETLAGLKAELAALRADMQSLRGEVAGAAGSRALAEQRQEGSLRAMPTPPPHRGADER
jgi:hypothetical protein